MSNKASYTLAEERYKIIFENPAEGAILIDDTGRIVEWNRFMENKTNLTKEKTVGRKIWDAQYSLLTKDYKEKYPIKSLKEIWMKFIDNLIGDEIITKEGQYLDKNGNIVLTEDVICPLSLNGKKYLYIIQRDLTKRKGQEQQLKMNEERLNRLNQNKDRTISIISHDLRSPITAIVGFSQLLCDQIKTYNFDKLEEYIEHINSSSAHTLRLLDNLLLWSKSQAGQLTINPQLFKLNSLISEIIEGLRPTAVLKNITLSYVHKDESVGYADVNILKTVLRNLVHNAIKFTFDGGKVEIYAKTVNDRLEITVADNGIGIDDETVIKLLQPGSEISKKGTADEKGSGLGLMLCRELIEKHGGKIWIESEPGKGSRFTFTIMTA